MKKLLPLAIMFLTTFCLTAQDITISFQPKIAGTQIDSIWVTNQKTDQKVKLLGGESLTLTTITGIDLFRNNLGDGHLYPNPGYGDAMLEFSTAGNQGVEIRVHNISGQLLSLERQNLPSGHHRFQVKFPGTGIYTVYVLKNSGPIGFKAVCTGVKMQECHIEYVGSESPKLLKSAKAGKTLGFTLGDILYYSVFSGKNNTIVSDSPTANKVFSVEFFECRDQDNLNYPIVKIGNQWWMTKNLAVLPSVSRSSASSETLPYFYVFGYEGTSVSTAKATSNYSTYGTLYNWAAAMNSNASSNLNPSGVRGVCPAGWHVPSDAEWTVLSDYLTLNGFGFQGSGSDIAKSLAARNTWNTYNIAGTTGNNPFSNNSSGFSALSSGGRDHNVFFVNLGIDCAWWSSTESSASGAWLRVLAFNYDVMARDFYPKSDGYSVRCVKD
jgi:uncharacterized protein (TIGR02145 family)